MKAKCRKITYKLMVFLLVITQFPVQAGASGTTVLEDEFTRTYVNTDLSETVEVFPYPLFAQNSESGKWEVNQNVSVESGSVSYVSEQEPDTNFSTSNEIKVGSDSNGTSEAYLKFGKSLPDLKGGLFLGAKLRIQELNTTMNFCYTCDYHLNDQYEIYSIQTPWDANELTWSNKPVLSELPVVTKTTMIPVNSTTLIWDVSGAVRNWYQNHEQDYGLAIKGTGLDSDVKSFTKLNTDHKVMPALQIMYSPKPQRPSGIANQLQQNSGKGYANLSWTSVPGAKGYRLYLFNGKEYEEVYEGTGTSWSSLGKNIWPTQAQIDLGELGLRSDGSGTDLSDQPGVIYSKQGDEAKREDTYYFRVSAFNEYGETDLSEEAVVGMPDATAPTIPANVRASNELISNFTLTWEPSQDRSGVNYLVKVTTSETGYEVFSGTTDTNSITIPESSLTLRGTYNVRVMATDLSYNRNYSVYSEIIKVTARRQFDSQITGWSVPTTVQEAGSSPLIRVVVKNTGIESWSKASGTLLQGNAMSVPLADSEVVKSDDIKVFEFPLPSTMPLGTITMNWQMFNESIGFFGERSLLPISFEDRAGPQISLASPSSNQQLSGKVVLQGQVKDYQLSKYVVSVGSGESPASWTKLDEETTPQANLGEWDTTMFKNGTYTIRVEGTDSSGNYTKLDRLVYVNNLVPAPVVNEVNDKSTTVTGKAKSATTILIIKNETVIASAATDAEGTFSVGIPVQTAGTLLKIVSVDGFTESTPVIQQVKDVTPPSEPVVNNVTNKSAAVTGKTEANAAVIIKIGTKTYSGKAYTTGNFSISIPIQNAGTAISVIVKDGAQLQSGEKKLVVSKAAPDLPIVNSVNNKAAVVSGKSEKYAVISVVIGSKTYTGKADVYGNYKVTIPIQNSGTAVNVTAKDSFGRVSAVRKVIVSRVAPNLPTVNTVNNKAASITGKTEKYATATAKIGTKTYSAKADVYGNYKIAIPIQNSGVKIGVTAKDSAGKISSVRTVTVAKVAPNIPTVNAARYYSTAVTGKTEQYAFVSVKIGTRVYSTKANVYGNFKVIIPKQRIGTKLVVTAKDSKGRISAGRTVTVY